MGQAVSELTQKETYRTEGGTLDESECSYNSHLKIEIRKNKNNQVILDMSMKELRRIFMKRFSKKSIDVLKLNDNYLKTLPHHVTCMMKLKEVYLQHNNFKYFPVQLCPLVRLEILDLSYNELDSLPYSIGNLVSLVKLDVSYNRIRSIPESIKLLRNISAINLNHNELWDIPTPIFNLSNLTVLNLSHNKLNYLPKHFLTLNKLQELDLRGNNIRKIHINLKEYLSRLTNLNLEQNNFRCSPGNNNSERREHDRTLPIVGKLDKPGTDSTYRQLPMLPGSKQILDKHDTEQSEENVYKFQSYVFTNSSYSSGDLDSGGKSTSL